MNKILCISSILLIAFACSNRQADNKDYDTPFESRFDAQYLESAQIKIIPLPQEIIWKNKKTKLRGINLISGTTDHNILLALNFILDEKGLNKKGDLNLIFSIDDEISPEGYELNISSNEVVIRYSRFAGAFNALQTFRQLIEINKGSTFVHNCSISDFPAHSIRGFMLDVGRNYQSLNSLKEIIRLMSQYKLNVFHWHLTDRPAWRIESKIHPELIDPANHRQTRDPGKYYTYDQIRELIQFARKLNVQIIPEIDMPGHSDSFITSTGVRMESEGGMIILESILTEFFSEISVEDCPVIHLGSDEVRIPEPDEFISKMTSICEAHGRKVMIWNPGLNANNSVIRQTWQSKHLSKGDYQEVDSWNNYVNNDEPHNIVSKLFFKPIGYGSENEIIGSILCLWPDVNIDNEQDAFRLNPLYPALISHSWACWTADITAPPTNYLTALPLENTDGGRYFRAFENFILEHKKIYFNDLPFPYYRQSETSWKIKIKSRHEAYKESTWLEANGNTLIFKDRFKLGGYFPDANPGDTAYAKRIIYSGRDQEVEVLIGFETPLRANRVYTGIPQNGSWDPNGGKIWINGEELIGPNWNNPGWSPSRKSGWGNKEEQEIPWGDEELYWTRKPTKIQLLKGENEVLFMSPYDNDYHNWMLSFVVLNKD